MDPLQFCYWLQGFAELNSGTPPNDMQWKSIRDHLATVFNKVTPTYPGVTYPGIVPLPSSQPWTVTCAAGTTSNTQTTAIC